MEALFIMFLVVQKKNLMQFVVLLMKCNCIAMFL